MIIAGIVKAIGVTVETDIFVISGLKYGEVWGQPQKQETDKMTNDYGHLIACHCCGLIQESPVVEAKRRLVCYRCETPLYVHASPQKSASRTAAAAFGAFCLFWPAILMPILEVEQLGNRSRSSITSGIIELFQHGSYFVGGIVFLFSILFPLAKIVMLFELSCLRLLKRHHKAFTLRLMEKLGKWSMMDVMLLAFLVMLVKLGDLVEFQFGPAIVAFVGCVAMSMLASLCFDPHAIWDDQQDFREV